MFGLRARLSCLALLALLSPVSLPAADQPGDVTKPSGVDLQILIGRRPIWLGSYIRYTLYDTANVEARIYALDGELISLFRIGRQAPGQHTVPWDGTTGEEGVFFDGKYYFELYFDDEYACKFWFFCKPLQGPT